MKSLPPRLVIYAKDVQRITGRSRRTAQEILQKIRVFFRKEANAMITIKEFCEFMKIEEQWVREYLD